MNSDAIEPLDLQATRLFGSSDRLDLLRRAAHILVLDNEEVNLRLITSMLQHAGYRSVGTLRDATDLEAQVRMRPPDLVILDLHMPVRDGFDVLRALQDRIVGEHLPVLVISGDDSTATRRRALALGARDFLAKPFDLAEMTLRVRNQLETRLLYQDVRKQNRALLQAVHGRTEELEHTRMEMLERLAIAAEYRDKDTSRHTERVGTLSAAIAQALGLPEPDVRLIKRAAPLHDVGKIGIPDALLLKPTGLTPQEIAVMQTHTMIGANILGGSHALVLRLAETIALSHHERWDGLGYPHRLVGDATPLVGRIVAVADTFDALTNDRPYRKAFSQSAGFLEIMCNRGTQFDARVVDAFAGVVEAKKLVSL